MASILDTYIALDLETTGLNPQEAEIIAIGAVKVENDEITDRFHAYVKPRMGIPDESARLTGITDNDVQKAPRIESVLETLLTFSQGLPIIAHQGRFEARFLSACSGLPFGGNIHSVRDLAQAVLPQLSDHRADTLADFFNIQTDSTEKALRDAEQIAGIYQGTVERLRNISLQLKQQMLQLLQNTPSTLLPILVALGNEAVKKEFLKRLPGGADPQTLFNLGGEEPRPQTDAVIEQPLEVDAIQALFDQGGPFDCHIEDYEIRPEQIEMAGAVSKAFNKNQLLAVEAGTGVGKSMAYLIPAIYHATQNNTRVIVSTNTKNLQEQLFFKDLPALEEVLDIPFSYALLKGRSNYICLNRWNAALSNVESVLTEDERLGALPLVVWAEGTDTGDIAENNGFNMRQYASLWAKVCSDSGYCRSQRCRTNSRCFANNIRRSAQKAHVAVVNHSLLFADIASENAVLGEYQDLILDEAHNVEKIAANYLGCELNIWHIRNLSEQLRSPGFSSTGTLPGLRHWMTVSNLKEDVLKPFDTGIGRAMDAAEALYLKAQTFFEDLTDLARLKQGNRRSSYTEKVRYKPGETLFQELKDSLQPFAEATAELGGRLQNLSDWLKNLKDDAFPNQDELRNELEGRIEECQTCLENLDHLTQPDDEQVVYWMELPGRDDSLDTRLFSAPLNVSEVLQTALYDKMCTVVFTSATLGIRGKLIYFLRRMGLEKQPEGRVTDLCLGSPFDYNTQALVCTPRFIPTPKSPDFQDAVDELLKNLALKVNRGTMALFTSYSMLNRSYNTLKSDLTSEGVLLLGQGIDGTRASITDRFKQDPGSMLLGTSSFWEGVDIPGEALEILGIVRLPFAVPSDPLVAAHMEEVEKQGKDAFLYYSVPEAILKFRQGFGRLIRNKNDRGIVIVLDSRVLSTRYGKAFLEALPVAHKIFQSASDMIGTIQTWFEQTDRANLS